MAVQMSATKPQYMQTLGLNPNVQAHRDIYVTMRTETNAAHAQLVSTRANLRPVLVSDLTVRSPYSYGQMDPAAINRTIQQIWANGSPTTRPFYDLGNAIGTETYNWAIRWLLYKRFRYTDRRNLRPSGGYNDDDEDNDNNDDDNGPTNGEVKTFSTAQKNAPAASQSSALVYDTARDRYRTP